MNRFKFLLAMLLFSLITFSSSTVAYSETKNANQAGWENVCAFVLDCALLKWFHDHGGISGIGPEGLAKNCSRFSGISNSLDGFPNQHEKRRVCTMKCSALVFSIFDVYDNYADELFNLCMDGCLNGHKACSATAGAPASKEDF